MDTIIVLTENPTWHQVYIKHRLRNYCIDVAGSFKENRLVINEVCEILFINPVGDDSDVELFAEVILDLTGGKCSEAVNSFVERRIHCNYFLFTEIDELIQLFRG